MCSLRVSMVSPEGCTWREPLCGKMGGSEKELVKERVNQSRGWSWVCVHVLCGRWEGEETAAQGHGEGINCFLPVL